MEVGGILIGFTRGSAVRIVETRPMEIAYGRGAFFLLTDAEHESLHRLIQQTNQDLAARGLGVVGYYESHTRRDVSLAEMDLETYDAHFSGPLRVCIVQKAEKENAITTAVYIRDESGNIVEAASSDILTSDALTSDDAAPLESQPVAASLVGLKPDLPPPPRSVEGIREREPLRPVPRAVKSVEWKLHTLQSPPNRRKWVYAAIAALMAAIAALMWAPRGPSSPPPAPSSVAGPSQPLQTPPPGTASNDRMPLNEVKPETPAKVGATRTTRRGKQTKSRRARARSATR